MWAADLLVALIPGVALFATLSLRSPDEPPPRWRLALADRLEVLAHALRRPRPVVPDPFVTLHVQDRLGAVARHVQRLEADTTVIARAEKIIATQIAYDYLLEEACRMAGVDVLPHAQGDPAERFREEVELAGRGWAW